MSSPITNCDLERPTTSSQHADMEDEEEVLIEPRFKYSRTLNDVSKVLENDSPSCIAIHDKFIAMGCQSGRIYLFDHLGNGHMECTARHHKCAVSCISIDKPGNYFISCANDFTVSIFGIGSNEYNQNIDLRSSNHAAKSVCIAEDFSRSGSGHRFVTGGRDLILYERNFLGRRKSTVIYQGLEKDGLITAVSWHGPYIGFTNESGTRIYDTKLSRTITLVQPLHKTEAYYSSKFPPRHSWLSSETLCIGWANTICVLLITTKRRISTTNTSSWNIGSTTGPKHGQILHRWILPDFFVAGISYTLTGSENAQSKWPSSLESPNGSVNGLNLTEAKATANPSSWREIVVFGLKLVEDGEGNVNDDKSSISNTSVVTTTLTTAMLAQLDVSNQSQSHRCSAQLLLLRPSALPTPVGIGSPSVDDFQLMAEDTIEMRQSEPKYLARFQLAALPRDNLFFLLGPKELIEAHPCSVDDRIAWFLENSLYIDAVGCAIQNKHSLQEISVLEVGKRLIDHLIEKGDFETAAAYLPQICAKHKTEWEYYVDKFESHHQILKLVPVIPTKEPRLESECYEEILTAALYGRTSVFRTLVSQWDPEIYRGVSGMVDKIMRRLKEDEIKSKSSGSKSATLTPEDQLNLCRSLAHLYVYQGSDKNNEMASRENAYNKAINLYLVIKDPTVFGVISKHNLFELVRDRVTELMDINQDLAIRLVLDNEEKISRDKILTQLYKKPKLQMAYLNRLLNQEGDLRSEDCDRLIKLYADYDRPKLLPFLRKSEKYNLGKALKVCKEKDFVEEKVFLLGRSGDRIGALDEIIKKLGNIELAIDFCTEHSGDAQLWNRLVEMAMLRPDHVIRLLNHVGCSLVEPLRVLEKIPPSMEIPTGLKNCLTKVLRDSEMQVKVIKDSLQVGNLELLRAFRRRIKPLVYEVNPESRCVVCSTSSPNSPVAMEPLNPFSAMSSTFLSIHPS
ncbi:hypothetical protein DdX_14179 [Ditylenchus destructor]|uniref:Vps41 beta-propeller domain-containing protein n=1 Tax=Ditylenchus destructor TaxID=166010 RepID=A0AAD4R241_9BILA|nr:hypothetical protein DdX_14179 [Ditylenchus destructor]